MPKVKKIPQRTCVGCREAKPKKNLIRIVRTPEHEIIVDPTGKANGRGAYICPKVECLEAAIRSKRLSRSLEIDISAEELNRIKKELEVIIESKADSEASSDRA
ncbi:MAG: YlxR family protein [Firmicutes bacterium]|nr:YlxR family protein [Bacillota bacterium]